MKELGFPCQNICFCFEYFIIINFFFCCNLTKIIQINIIFIPINKKKEEKKKHAKTRKISFVIAMSLTEEK